MLDGFTLGNFKGFKGLTEVRLSPLTLIYGPNSSGKSALIQALAVCGQSTPQGPYTRGTEKESWVFSGDYVDLGGYQNVVHGHDLSQSMTMGLSASSHFGLDRRLRAPWPLDTRVGVTYSLGTTDDGHIESTSTRFDVGEHSSFYLSPQSPERVTSQLQLDLPTLHHLIEVATKAMDERGEEEEGTSVRERLRHQRVELLKTIADASQAEVEQALGRLVGGRALEINSTGPWSRLVSPPELRALREVLADEADVLDSDANEDLEPLEEAIRDLVTEFIAAVTSGLRVTIRHITYLGPIRAAPQRIEDPQGVQSRDIYPDGRGTTGRLYRSAPLSERVNEALASMGVPYSIKAVKISNSSYPTVGEFLALQLTDLRTSIPVSLADVGYGISQLLPIVTEAMVRRGGPLLVEQPELHLHPRLQGSLAELLARTSQDRQIVAETHSESMILRLQKLIRLSKLDPDHVSVIYVGSDERSGSGSWVEHIRFGESGEMLQEWPDGFFEERLEDY